VPWLRRLITRLLAIIPAVIAVIFFGERGTAKLLNFSQVILSLQLSFAVIPLVLFTGDRRKMGEFVNPRWLQLLAWITATMTLEPGDLVLTGTPSGVGPLKAGDVVEVSIDGLGVLRNEFQLE